MISTDINDWSLLRQYVEHRSETAFETLLQRHLDMVFSAAWRQAGDPELAEEVTQAVFVLLARKAARLRGGVVIAGWLYRTAGLTARRALRDQTRRRIKDWEAAEMKLTDSNDDVWTRLMPFLDPALANLAEEDRMAIVLRFLERRSFRDVAAALSISEDAAKKRVTRALEKLQLVFTRQGLTLGLGVMAAALSERALEAAPAGLLSSSVQAGLSGGMAAGPGVLALVAGVVRETLISRLKVGGALAGVVLLAAVVGVFNWLTPKSAGPEDAGSPLAGKISEAVASNPLRLPSQRSESDPAPTDRRSVILRVITDESDQPLADIAVHVLFIIRSKSTFSTFRTDSGGATRIALPTGLDFMNYWVSTPGRVPMTIFWQTKENLASLMPEYTLRLPQGRLVAGTVVDEAGQPVAGAAVHFQGDGMAWDSREYADYQGPMSLPQSDRPTPPMTDPNGRWSADFISPKAKSLFGYVEHAEFATTQFGHVQPPDPIEPSTNLVLVLERGASVVGVVRDAAGLPIQEADVNLDDRLGLPHRWMQTDAAGEFEFPRVAEDNNIVLTVNARGFQPSGELTARRTQPGNLDIVLKAVAVAGNSVIRGRLVSEDGNPIGGVGVSLAPDQPGLEEISWGATTDADGRFAWISAPDHPVKLVIRGPIWDWEKQQVVLAPDGTETVIVLKPKIKIQVHGTVLDKLTGSPVPEFKVLLGQGIKNGYVVNTTLLTEGREGKFAVNMLPENIQKAPGTSTRLDFHAPGYVNTVVFLSSETNDIKLTVELEPAVDIAGAVLRPDGNPAADARVFFRGEHFCFRVGENCSVSMPAYPFAVDTRTGVDGAFRIPKIGGIDRLEVVHPEGWADVPLDRPSTAVISLKAWGRIRGVVQSDQAVRPGVEVQASQARTASEQMMFGFTVKTDSEGRFKFSQVPGGRAMIRVTSAPDGLGANIVPQEIQVAPGQTATLTLSSKVQ